MSAVKQSSSKLPWMLGGLGLAALENAYIAPDLDPGLKKINLGIGTLTGMLAHNPATQYAALSGLPLKEIALFGINSADKLRKQQQSLVNANLGVANINRQTAEITHNNAASQKTLSLAFLLPALAAGAGVGYMGYERWNKAKTQIPRYKTMGEAGRDSSSRSKIRIDIPSSAVPRDFYDALSNPDESSRAHLKLLRLTSPDQAGEVSVNGAKAASADEQQHVSIPRALWSIGKEVTGLPSIGRAMQDVGAGASNFMSGDFGQAARYGLGAAGNAAFGLVGLRTGLAPVLGRMIGAQRLRSWMQPGKLKQLFGVPLANAGEAGFATQAKAPLLRFPWLGGFLSRHSGAGAAFNDARLSRDYAYNPEAFAWKRTPGVAKAVEMPPIRVPDLKNPGSMNEIYQDPHYVGEGLRGAPVVNALYKGEFSAPATNPTGLIGQMANLGRYGGNRAMQSAYWLRQMAHRNPNMALTAAGMPLAGLGYEADRRHEDESRQAIKGYLPNWAAGHGQFGTPISDTVGRVMQMTGMPDVHSPLRDQINTPQAGGFVDPFRSFR